MCQRTPTAQLKLNPISEEYVHHQKSRVSNNLQAESWKLSVLLPTAVLRLRTTGRTLPTRVKHPRRRKTEGTSIEEGQTKTTGTPRDHPSLQGSLWQLIHWYKCARWGGTYQEFSKQNLLSYVSERYHTKEISNAIVWEVCRHSESTASRWLLP